MSHSIEGHSSPVPMKKKKKDQDFYDFFMKQIKSLDAADKSNEFSRFSEEVADDIRRLSNSYSDTLAMRDIRDIVFKYCYLQIKSKKSPVKEESIIDCPCCILASRWIETRAAVYLNCKNSLSLHFH
mgnify:CR=1 FL=1